MPVPVSELKSLVGGEDFFAVFMNAAEEGQMYTYDEVRRVCGVGDAGVKRSMRTHTDVNDWRIRVAKGYRYGTPKTVREARKVLNA